MDTAPSPAESVIRLIARSEPGPDAVAALLRRAGSVTGAARLAFLDLDAVTGRLTAAADAGPGLPAGTSWMTAGPEASLASEVLAAGRHHQFKIDASAMPELARRLGTPAAILAPVSQGGQPFALLVLGVPAIVPALEWSGPLAECTDAMALVMAAAAARRDAARQRDLQGLVVALGRSGTPTIPTDRFEAFCGDLARTVDAGRVEVWHFDRHGRKMERLVSARASADDEAAEVPLDALAALVTDALRHQRAAVVPAFAAAAGAAAEARTTTITVPLQGRRRALGVLLLEGIRLPQGSPAVLLQQLDGFGHQLANVIESTQLLDDVLRTRRELENTFDSMRDLVTVISHDGRVTHVNQAVVRRLHRLRGELVGQPVASMVGDTLARWLSEPDAGTDDAAMMRTVEVNDPVLGGTFLVTVTPLAEKNPSLTGSVLVARDVSEERRLGAERAALREQLARSEALGHLVAGIAHELNNPLQAVLGHIELMQRTRRLAAPLASGLRQVYKESDRAARIVHNLLVLAGSGQVAKRPVSVNAALRRALALRSASCRRAKVTVVRRLPATIPSVAGDGLLLQQAFLNLLLNAEQALEGRPGRIEVRSSYSTSRKQVTVEVKDSGSGIAPEILPRVFDPFFTTKDTGSGLGLAMTLRIVREHGGDVMTTPRPGGGAVFTVTLPAMPKAKR